MIIALLFHSHNNNLKEIQQIFTFTEIANLTTQVVGVIANLTMMTKKKQLERSDSKPNEKYFNCRKKALILKIITAPSQIKENW